MKTVIVDVKLCDQDCDQEAVTFGFGFQMCKVHAKEFQEELERDKLEEYMLDARREWEERFGTDEELGLTN